MVAEGWEWVLLLQFLVSASGDTRMRGLYGVIIGMERQNCSKKIMIQCSFVHLQFHVKYLKMYQRSCWLTVIVVSRNVKRNFDNSIRLWASVTICITAYCVTYERDKNPEIVLRGTFLGARARIVLFNCQWEQRRTTSHGRYDCIVLLWRNTTVLVYC